MSHEAHLNAKIYLSHPMKREIRITRPVKPEAPKQANNPLHGIKLKDMLQYLLDYYGWEELGERINIRCFQSNPTMNSSLKFLRTTPWAREKVENLYLRLVDKQA